MKPRKQPSPAGMVTLRQIVGLREVTKAEADSNWAKSQALARLTPSELRSALQSIGPRRARPAIPGAVPGLVAADLWAAVESGALPAPVRLPRRGYAWPLAAVQALRK